LSRRDNLQSAATVKMAFPTVAAFSSRLSRYKLMRNAVLGEFPKDADYQKTKHGKKG